MRILVTGGAGFIGSYLVRALLARGDEPVVFDLVRPPDLLADCADKITYVQGDLGSDIDLYRTLTKHKPEAIFHLGALLAGPCEQNPSEAFRVNFRSTQVLLDAAVTIGIKKFFFMSSISIYSNLAPEPVREDALKIPANIYGQTKLAGEFLVEWYAKNHNLDVRGIRPTWVWGPKRTNGLTAKYTTFLVDSIVRGQVVHVPNPEDRGDWIYIEDTIKAMLLVWDAKELNQAFYTVGGSVHTLREVAEIAAKYVGNPAVNYAESKNLTSPYAVRFDDSSIKQELGYVPDFSIERSVQAYIDFVRADSATV